MNESKTVTKDPICDMTVEQATTFILGWFAGFLIVGPYNLSLGMRKWK